MAESEAKTEPKTEETTETKEEEYKEGKASMVNFWVKFFIVFVLNLRVFQGDFIGGLKREFFGSYEAPPYTVVNTFEVNGKKVRLSKI